MMSASPVRKSIFPVGKVSCAGCTNTIQRVLCGQKGVQTAEVNFVSKTATVVYDSSVVTPLELQASVRSAGYEMVITLAGDDDSE
jgi:copper chaperone CopZ